LYLPHIKISVMATVTMHLKFWADIYFFRFVCIPFL